MNHRRIGKDSGRGDFICLHDDLLNKAKLGIEFPFSECYTERNNLG